MENNPISKFCLPHQPLVPSSPDFQSSKFRSRTAILVDRAWLYGCEDSNGL